MEYARKTQPHVKTEAVVCPQCRTTIISVRKKPKNGQRLECPWCECVFVVAVEDIRYYTTRKLYAGTENEKGSENG